jgi:hypothetical protein
VTALARIVAMERLNGDKTVPFEAWFECSSCHARVHLGDRFCRWCGIKFGGTA